MFEKPNDWVEILRTGVEQVRVGKRAQVRLDDWFFVQEIKMEEQQAMEVEGRNLATSMGAAELLCRIVRRIPISIPAGSALAGSQDCAFSPSYALINPSFKVEQFAGYCDPTAIYDDISPATESGLTAERIARVRGYWENTPYTRELKKIYARTGAETKEVVYFVEPVTGHTIPDLRPFLKHGVGAMLEQARREGGEFGRAMATALEAVLILAERYRELALTEAARREDQAERLRLTRIADLLERVPAHPARDLHEAVAAFALLWQIMALEQAPNPYAFSVGNLDRILAPYYDPTITTREEAVELVRHLLCFFQVGKSCWAISQNVLVGGRDEQARDLTSGMTQVVLDAFFASNDPQPALSVKVHAGTPPDLYHSLGRFFFTAGHATPSLFNDDTVFELLRRQGVAESDLPDYAIAGCQEPLIMGKSSLNTTNTWLNLAKILELAANDGRSLISGEALGPSWADLGLAGGAEEAYASLQTVLFRQLDHFLPRLREAGNACTTLLGREKPVPFTSAMMDGFNTWRELRDPEYPGVRYGGSGCLIHGLSVVADSLYAVDRALNAGGFSAAQIREALANDFAGHEGLRLFLLSQEKFGSGRPTVDTLAARLVAEISRRVGALANPAGHRFLADWSTPSTHLLYGYWVGATPDGRRARTMLGYGLDPRPEATRAGLPERFISAWRLPYLRMVGGYASHIGLHPSEADHCRSMEEKGAWMYEQIIRPLFWLGYGKAETPFYVYFNVDEADHLRAVLREPEKHAPTGVYILRIHGTFVNFLDLSPAIQEDIIARLEAGGGKA